MPDYQLVFDGGSLGNPGKGYGSYRLSRVSDGKRMTKRLEFGDHVTNNQAEYRTLIAGLEDSCQEIIRAAGKPVGEFTVAILGDSNLVVEQVNGRWKVHNSGLRPLNERAVELFRSFGAGINHHVAAEGAERPGPWPLGSQCAGIQSRSLPISATAWPSPSCSCPCSGASTGRS